MTDKVEVIVGTYEEYLLGYKVGYAKNGKESLIQSFATRSHTASVRCVAVSGKYLASGGADDRIYLYDMQTRREIQVLIHHEGTVNAVEFTPDATHILSGGDDGKIVAVRTNTWQVEATWKKAHSGAPVTHISCHPSGKLALSLGNDLTLRTWNLIKGRLAFTTNLKSIESLGKAPDCIFWSPCGNYFTLTGPRVVGIWGIKTAALIKEQNCESRPISVCWLTSSKLLVGLENGKLMLLGVQDPKDPVQFTAHKQRVKAISYVNEVLATASSSGEVSLWNIDIKEETLTKVCSLNTGCRPTCIGLIDLTQFGDDYILKKEKEDAGEQICKQADEQSKTLETGTVVIEYDEDEPIIEAAKAFKAKVEVSKTSKKCKVTPSKPGKNEKVTEKEDKEKESQWSETAVKKTNRNESEISDDDPKWCKSQIKNKVQTPQEQSGDLKPNSKKKISDVKKKTMNNCEESKDEEQTSKSQCKEIKVKNEFKKLSVELKRPPNPRGRKNINYLTKTESKRAEKEDSDATMSCDEGEMPKLKREVVKSDTTSVNSDDPLLDSPKEKKKKYDAPKKKPKLRGQKGRK